MHKNIVTGLRICSALVMASGYLALAATPHYPPAIVLIPLVLFLMAPMGERLDAHFTLYRKATSWISAGMLTLAIISLFFIDLLSSVTMLVIYIQAYTLLHRKETRNYYHLFLMAFFLLLAACVMSPDPQIGLVMILFLVTSIASFFLLHLHTELRHDPECGTIPIVPLDTEDLPIQSSAPKAFDLGLVAVMTAVVVAVALGAAALFYTMPRMQAGMFGRSDPAVFRSAFAQTVDLARGGRILSDQTPVMRVEFPEEPEGQYNGVLFWRITGLNTYEGARWVALHGLSNVRSQPMYSLGHDSEAIVRTGRPDTVAREHFGVGRVVRQSIYMDSVPEEGIPALPMVEKVQSGDAVRDVQLFWDEGGNFTAMMRGRRQRWLHYDAWSEVQEFTQEQLRAAPDNYRDVLAARDYEELTFNQLQPRTQQLAKEIADGKTTVYDKAVAIGAYFNNGGYFYTVELPSLPPDHPVDAFVHETRRGHCELFASATALMLRSLGIPARVAVGYRGGDWSGTDRAYIVRADMAHAWVEVYFIGLGWVSFDPSPADPGLSGFSKTWIARMFARYSLRAKMAWYQSVIGFDQGMQIATLKNMALGLVGIGSDMLWGADRAGGSASWIRFLTILIVLGAGFAGLVSVTFLRRDTASGRAALLTVDQTRAVRLYRRLQRKLARMGAAPAGKSAEELYEAILLEPYCETAPVRELIDAYNEVRFGAKPLPVERYARLRDLLRQLQPTKHGQ